VIDPLLQVAVLSARDPEPGTEDGRHGHHDDRDPLQGVLWLVREEIRSWDQHEECAQQPDPEAERDLQPGDPPAATKDRDRQHDDQNDRDPGNRTKDEILQGPMVPPRHLTQHKQILGTRHLYSVARR
jgi:hypothetical protein